MRFVLRENNYGIARTYLFFVDNKYEKDEKNNWTKQLCKT